MWERLFNINLNFKEIHSSSFVLGVVTGTAISGLYAIIKKMCNKPKENSKDNFVDDCVLFLPDQDISEACFPNSTRMCNRLTCALCSTKKILLHVKSSQTQLDICMYLITLKELTDAVIELFKSGVFVRVITDKQMSEEANKSKVFVFLKNYVPIKIIKSAEMMHNKFIIIDNKKLITGSFNWTNQGLKKNFENGIIIHNDEIIRKYREYFDVLWHSASSFH